MATITIKDRLTDNQAVVTNAGALLVQDVLPGELGWNTFGQSTPKQVLVTNSSTELLAANSNRVYASISNNSNQTIYFQYGNAALWQEGYVLRPNATWIISTTELFLGQINAITNTGSVNIDVIEGIV